MTESTRPGDHHIRAVWALGLAAASLCATVVIAAAQTADPPPEPPESLKTVPVPEPPNLADFVRDRDAAVRLGKALFWDMQVGGDSVQACASCHFHAGADIRRKNQLNPAQIAGDTVFDLGGPNYTVRPRDFPFTRHADEQAADSPITSDINDVMGSQGVFRTDFLAPGVGGEGADECRDVPDPIFHVGGINVRQTTGRNAPSPVNAVFNHRNFWDGRANQNFNGASPFGKRDPNARVWRTNATTGSAEPVTVVIPHGSLASQATAPPLSDVEMSCAGRKFAQAGRKLLDPALVPLNLQEVHPNDSELGPIARRGTGLSVTYTQLVQQAFRPEWWNASNTVTVGGEEFTQMEANFSLFFGLAVQLYEATLVADDTPLDRRMEGDSTAFNSLEEEGLSVFMNEGKCINCHGGAELTKASVRHVENERLERMVMGDGGCAIYDNGFYNIGVRPTADDPGVGGTDPFGNPLSDTRMAMQGKFHDPNLDPPLGEVPECDSRAAVDGNFKTPALRNVLLTGPYFHNGGKATLRQVVEFYNRGGDFADVNIHDLDPDIQPLGLTNGQKAALVAFLEALTDERVRQESAPFDHPQLFRPQGHPGDEKKVEPEANLIRAQDDLFEVAAVGTGGRPAEGLIPLQPFLTIAKLTGSGRVGVGRDIAHFGVKFRQRDGAGEGRVRVRDHAAKLKIRADQVDRFFTTETCVEMSGPAEVNESVGYAYTTRACDSGQFKHNDDDDRDDDQPGRRDWFEVTVTGPNAFHYHREGRLTGGNVQTHIR